jgi:hypothetical protein
MDNLKLKSFEWIVSAIQSSTNQFHLECCRKLIDLYSQKFGEEDKNELDLMLSEKSVQLNYF